MSSSEQPDIATCCNVSDEELRAVEGIINVLLKARKILRMYPSNNPLYTKNLDDILSRFKDYFEYKEELQLSIGQYHIYYDTEQVYHNPSKEDNLALFLFKDGVRELTFSNELSSEEIEAFMNIITTDFNTEELDDDVVTMLWEKDFQYIRYVVDESYFHEDDYESKALTGLREQPTDPDSLKVAHEDFSIEGEDVEDLYVGQLSDEDIELLMNELEKDSSRKTAKMAGILFEVLHEAGNAGDYNDLVQYFIDLIEFLIKQGDLHETVKVQTKLAQITDDDNADSDIKNSAARIISFSGSRKTLKLVGEYLDQGGELDADKFSKYVAFLDSNAVPHLMTMLGGLQNPRAQRMIMDSLVYLGNRNMPAILAGLNDSKWHVVRSTLLILRRIGDPGTVGHLIKTLKHRDIRVKSEALRGLGKLGGSKALDTLILCLEDSDVRIRTAAVSALADTASDDARKIIMDRIAGRQFGKKDFPEKKVYFKALSRWNDDVLSDFLSTLLNRKSLWKGSKFYEKKACAAYCLGLTGNRSLLPLLDKYKTASHKLLREYSLKAIQRMGND